MLIGIAGANGFVGKSLSRLWIEEGHQVVAIGRAVEGADSAWRSRGESSSPMDLIVNCAGKVGRRDDAQEAELFSANADFPVRLYRAGVETGARHFVHISSCAALASSSQGMPDIEDSTPASPSNAYGRSKLAGERALCAESGPVPLLILRPPIIYGINCGGAFGLLSRAARSGVPLPLRGLSARRSTLYVGNLGDAILRACQQRSTGAFIVTDGAPVTVDRLYDGLCRAWGRHARSFSLPAPVVPILIKAAMGARSDSLLEDAVYDDSAFRKAANWSPPFSLDEALARSVRSDA